MNIRLIWKNKIKFLKLERKNYQQKFEEKQNEYLSKNYE